MLFLLPIIILSAVLLTWTFMMSSIIVGIFPIFTSGLIIISLFGTLSFLMGIVGANVWPRLLFSRMYFLWAISLGSITVAWFIATIMLLAGNFFEHSYEHIFWIVSFIFLAISINVWAIYSSWVPRIKKYNIKFNKDHLWHGKKIAMIADTHYGNIYWVKEARSLVTRINALNPEIVIIPGDFFDGPLIDYASIVREFGCINAEYGVLFANWNHEEYTHTKEILKTIKNPVLGLRRPKATQHLKNSLYECNQEITVINNEKIEVNGIVFSGVTYHDTEDIEGLTKNLDSLSLESEKINILLKHKPTLHSTLEKYPIDLVVSWHTHQAQMWPFSLVTYMIFGKYVYGKVENNNLISITTSWVGSWWPPHRLGTRSEIVLLEIE